MKPFAGNSLTPLHFAAGAGHETTVKLLLENGASVKDLDYRHKTPLFSAACGGHEGVVEVLLKHGADVNAPNDQGNPPLLAVMRDAIGPLDGVVRLLVSGGARLDILNLEGLTALHLPLSGTGTQ